MPCSKVTIKKTYKCDKATCICIPTDGKSCICICENENGDIMQCDDCKCKSDNCQCKCDDSKCTCIVTKGASCICVCRDERGNFKTCDCSCVESDEARPCCEKDFSVKFGESSSKKLEKNVPCNCDGKRNIQDTRRDVKIFKNYKCDQTGCVCIPTGGKPCICICEDENGDIIRCDDCKCKSDNCQCKCDDSKCTCIVTKGASCICVCRDERGNFKTCDCSCVESDEARPCCEKDFSVKFGESSSKKPEKNIPCKCDGKRNINDTRRDVKILMNHKRDETGCVCIPTGGKPCICICEDENGDIMRCDDCKCKSDNCQCKCDDSKCTCIVTKGASCICVCRDKRGNFKVCDCSCIESDEERPCCEKNLSVKFGESNSKKLEKNIPCKCDGKRNINDTRRDVKIFKNHKCDQSGCVCIPTGGKPCICICEDENGDIMRCDDCKCKSDNCQCKCDDSKCTCIVTKGASCICVCRDKRGNFKVCDCSCVESDEAKPCCEKYLSVKFDKSSSKKLEKDMPCKCDGKRNIHDTRRDVKAIKNYKCDQTGCVCISTGGKPCICICEDENGDIMRCDDCKCKSDNCQCKCDDSKCTCIVTRGASCICVCRDEKGNFKTCDCCCVESNEVRPCCEKDLSVKFGESSSKKLEKNIPCKCDGKRNINDTRRDVKIFKNYKCYQTGCVCIPTGGKPCICICEDENGDISRCDDCKCKSDNCQCKCDDSKCTCIVTKGASCICVCRDKKGNFKICDCSCVESDETRPRCKKGLSVKFNECCGNQLETEVSGIHSNCDGKPHFQALQSSLINNKNDRFVQAERICKPTVGKPVICVYTNYNGDIVQCDDCKCYSEPNPCCKTENFVSRKSFKQLDKKRNCKYGNVTCCVLDNQIKFCVSPKCTCAPIEKSCLCENKKGDLVCCNDCKFVNNTKCDKYGCICVSEINACNGRDVWDDSFIAKRTNRPCVCGYQNNFNIFKCNRNCNALMLDKLCHRGKTCDNRSRISPEAYLTCASASCCKENVCLMKRGNADFCRARNYQRENRCACVSNAKKSGYCVRADNQSIYRDYARNCNRTCLYTPSKGNCVCVGDVTVCRNYCCN